LNIPLVSQQIKRSFKEGDVVKKCIVVQQPLDTKGNQKIKKRTMLPPTGSSGPAVLFSPALRPPQQGAASVQ